LLAAAAGGAGVWYFGSDRGRADDGPVAGAGAGAGPGGEPDGGALVIADPPATPDAGAPEPVVDAGPSMVTVSVSTSPRGARVYVEDRGEVCSETPCDFETPAGEAITVRARRGRYQGETEITPEDETEALEVEMRRIRPAGGRGRGRGRGRGGEQSGGGGGGGSGDLKIPDIFR
ncbi:MAG TPA: PEGA domain-containing protein, partial [Sandaracinaceae bacterium LLY-WYZ-13_1]|nr:PEGA domain-containing protein [Sandaracinaceae bacterium LLY-WYZ-13_1]